MICPLYDAIRLPSLYMMRGSSAGSSIPLSLSLQLPYSLSNIYRSPLSLVLVLSMLESPQGNLSLPQQSLAWAWALGVGVLTDPDTKQALPGGQADTNHFGDWGGGGIGQS
jgi:hypothetical protein